MAANLLWTPGAHPQGIPRPGHRGPQTLSLWLCHVGMGRGQQAGTKVIWELESIESRVLILLPPLHFQCSDFMKF